MPRIITLTTDFGSRDAYVAAMKGVILSICPDARLVDVSHEIAPQDIMEAAFVLRDAVQYFPAGTVHLAVVDPGVGGSRRAVALSAGDQLFVGPDNGLFTLLMGSREPDELVVLSRAEYWRTPAPSTTFHGRDIFAPAAAHLACGKTLQDVGVPSATLEPLYWALPIADEQGVQGWVVHVDRFGNCITNISRALLDGGHEGRTVKCYVGTAIIPNVQNTYGDVASGEPLALFGSSGFLEVAVNNGNASKLFSIRKGASVNIVFTDKRA